MMVNIIIMKLILRRHRGTLHGHRWSGYRFSRSDLVLLWLHFRNNSWGCCSNTHPLCCRMLLGTLSNCNSEHNSNKWNSIGICSHWDKILALWMRCKELSCKHYSTNYRDPGRLCRCIDRVFAHNFCTTTMSRSNKWSHQSRCHGTGPPNFHILSMAVMCRCNPMSKWRIARNCRELHSQTWWCTYWHRWYIRSKSGNLGIGHPSKCICYFERNWWGLVIDPNIS